MRRQLYRTVTTACRLVCFNSLRIIIESGKANKSMQSRWTSLKNSKYFCNFKTSFTLDKNEEK